MARFPYHHLVPRDHAGNESWRLQVLKESRNNRRIQAMYRRMCEGDALFWINTFCYIFEPRDQKFYPWITYSFQDQAMGEILDAIGHHDLVIEKSRDMGASWMCAAAVKWSAQFTKFGSYLMMSWKEELVDSKDPKSLFWKLDKLQQYQPDWLKQEIRPGVERTDKHIRHPATESTINGEATTERSSTGDRRTAVLLDEFSKMGRDAQGIMTATRDVTRSRIFNFTPFGGGHISAQLARNAKFRKLRLHWSLHPEKRKGLYTVRDGQVEILDKDYVFPDGYPFVTTGLFFFGDGRLRSPWYDQQCDRAQTRWEIAQELDIDYAGSDVQFFEQSMLDRVKVQYCRLPDRIEPLTFVLKRHDMPKEFWERCAGGRLSLWCRFDGHDRPASDRMYFVGLDVSAGTGSSNSTMAVLDGRTGEQVMSFAWSQIQPQEFAHLAMAVGRYFHGSVGPAQLIWESNGPGRVFGQAVMDEKYPNIWWRRNEQSVDHKVSMVPGWAPTRENKVQLLGEFQRSLAHGDCICRDEDTIGECAAYIHLANGAVEHSSCAQATDPTGAGSNHGDRVIASALARWCMKDLVKVNLESDDMAIPARPPVGSMAWRRQQDRLEHTRAEGEEWL